jgi:hypothetical protein
MAPRNLRANPNYLVQIKKNIGAGWDEVIASCPEEVSLQVASEYEARYANMLAEKLGAAGQLGTDIFGAGAFHQALTSQLWVNSSPLELQLTIIFDAETDAATEVMEQTKKLMSWVMPSRTTDVTIESPGPTLSDPDKNRIILHIGRTLTFNSVVIPSVNVNYVGAADANGNYIAASADVTFRTFLTPHREEFLTYFNQGGMGNEGTPEGAANLGKFTGSIFSSNIFSGVARFF